MTAALPLSPWARERERGGVWLVRLMVWISLRLGRVLGELLLWPISAWFLATSPVARAASRDYLGRVLGRPVRLSDVARHFHAFAQSLLDRVFFVSGGVAGFETEVEGLAPLLAHIEAGRGCVLFGAHLGSFDAMRALGRHAPVRVRPAMFRANGGALTALLERLDPALSGAIIDLGKPEAMLRVREALARGDLVAFLADRAIDPRRLIALPFLGAPAPFPTGPFQIAALLEAPAMMFHGLRAGRRRYRLRFEPLPPCGATHSEGRTEALRRTMDAYVERLEATCRAHPFQWFNFYPFWKDAPAAGRTRRASTLALGLATLETLANMALAATLGFALLVASLPARAADDPALLDAIMRTLADQPMRQATFREEKTLPNLTRPLNSSGTLIYRRPDRLEKRTLSPIRETLLIEGRRASVTGADERTHTLDVDAHAELRLAADTLLGVLSGDLAKLRADFDVGAEGGLAGWRLTLTPRGPDAPRLLRSALVTGRGAAIREIRLLLPRDAWNVLTVDGG